MPPASISRLLRDDAAHGLTVSPPNRDKLTMRSKSLKSLSLMVRRSKASRTMSLSKDEAWDFRLFQHPEVG